MANQSDKAARSRGLDPTAGSTKVDQAAITTDGLLRLGYQFGDLIPTIPPRTH
jgi:hypothetical protein